MQQQNWEIGDYIGMNTFSVCVCVVCVSVKRGRKAYNRKIGTDSGKKSLRPDVRSLKKLIKLTAHFQY